MSVINKRSILLVGFVLLLAISFFILISISSYARQEITLLKACYRNINEDIYNFQDIDVPPRFYLEDMPIDDYYTHYQNLKKIALLPWLHREITEALDSSLVAYQKRLGYNFSHETAIFLNKWKLDYYKNFRYFSEDSSSLQKAKMLDKTVAVLLKGEYAIGQLDSLFKVYEPDAYQEESRNNKKICLYRCLHCTLWKHFIIFYTKETKNRSLSPLRKIYFTK